MSKLKDISSQWKEKMASLKERWNDFAVRMYDFFAGLDRQKVSDFCRRSWQAVRCGMVYCTRHPISALTKTADVILNFLGAFHRLVASVFLGIGRNIGKLFGLVPWGLRYSIVLAFAMGLMWLVIAFGSSALLLKSPSELEPFNDRNRNTVVFSDGSTPDILFSFFDLSAEKRSLLGQLDKSINDAIAKKFDDMRKNNPYAENDGSQTIVVCEDSHLSLLSKISGVDRSYFASADAIRVENREESVELNLTVEYDATSNARFATRASFKRVLLNPTEEQRKILDDLPAVSEAAGDVFNPGRTSDLQKLFSAPNLKKDDSDNREVPFQAKNFIVREFTANHEEAVIRVFLTKTNLGEVDPMKIQEIKEAIEDKFDKDNTVPTGRFKQYSIFREINVKDFIDKRIDDINEKSFKLASHAHEQDVLKHTQEAEQEIKTLEKDLGKKSHKKKRLKPADREAIMATHLAKVKPLVFTKLERKAVPDSEIAIWVEEAYKTVQFNGENSRFEPAQLELIGRKNLTADYDSWSSKPAWCVLGLLALAVVLGFATLMKNQLVRRSVYYVMLCAGIAFAVYWTLSIYFAFDLPDQFLNIATKKEAFTSVERNDIWFDYIWLWWPGFLFSVFTWLPLLTPSAKKFFFVVKSDDSETGVADNMVTELSCRGKNKGLVSAFYWCLSYHFFLLIILPVILECCNSVKEDEYSVPKGDGGGVIQQVVQVKKKPKKKKKRYLLNPNSSVIFDTPDLPDEELLEELDRQTESTYVTSNGSMGPNKKGGKPGWPNGMEGGKVRFIRLKYGGGDWDQDMGKGADYNLLIKIHEYAGFEIAKETEAFSVEDLAKSFRKKGKKPPFVFITGRGNINMSNKEIKILRDYLLKDGGMIFADNGGGNFHSSFVNLMKRILPNHGLVDIANDDIIYQQPFYFPNGAPALFHHSGRRALGIKNNGRWVVFYHQGDINDAWKTGASGLSKQQQDQAFKLGANVIAYAFGEYLRITFGE